MTSTIAPRKNDLTTTASTASSAPETGISNLDGTIGDVSEMSLGAVDSFTPTKAAAPKLPLNPPASPELVDEKTAKNSDDLADIRAQNRDAIKQYNKDYGAYLKRYTDFVERAPNLEAATQLGEPAGYDPTAKLPVAQKKSYDDLQKSALANPVALASALGAHVMKEGGVKDLPGSVHAYFEIELNHQNIGTKTHIETTDAGVEVQKRIGGGVATEHGTGAKVWVDPMDLKKNSVEIDVAHGGLYTAIESDSDGSLTMENGVEAEVGHVGVKAGVQSGVSPAEGRVELGLVGGAKFHDNEVVVRGGAVIGLLDEKAVDIAVNSKGAFDKQLKANLVVGR